MGKPTKQPSRVQGFETLHELGNTVKKSVVDDGWKETWNQILGLNSSKLESHAPELTITDPISHKKDVFDASKHQSHKSAEAKQVERPHAQAEAAINYQQDVLKNSERASKQETHEVNQRLQQIMVELQKLVNSSKVLQMEFAGVSVDQAPQQAGEYHLNFFDWLLLTIRSARQKVEDSGAWLATGKKKGGGKGSWNNKQRKDWFANTQLSMGNESGGGYINQTG